MPVETRHRKKCGNINSCCWYSSSTTTAVRAQQYYSRIDSRSTSKVLTEIKKKPMWVFAVRSCSERGVTLPRHLPFIFSYTSRYIALLAQHPCMLGRDDETAAGYGGTGPNAIIYIYLRADGNSFFPFDGGATMIDYFLLCCSVLYCCEWRTEPKI